MFNIFALVLITVTTSLGPAGTHAATIQMTQTGFETQNECNNEVASLAASKNKQTLLAYLNTKVRDEFKDHVDVQLICSDKTIEDLAPEGSKE